MEINLTNHPKFQSLSPEAKQIALDKYNAMAPEARAIVDKKMYAVPEEVRNEKPLKDVGSEYALEGVLAGPVIKGAGALAKTGVSKLRGIAETLSGPGREAAEMASKQAITGLEERLLAQQGALASVPQRVASRGQNLATAKLEYGKAIGKAEELGGFSMKSTPSEAVDIIKDPTALKTFSNSLRKIADTPVEQLVKSGDKMALQHVRKFGQTFREIGPKLNKEITSEIRANVKMGAGKATEALSKMDETFGKAIEAWSKVDDQIRRLGPEQKFQKAAISQSMRQTKHAIKMTKKAASDAIQAGARRDKVREILTKYGLAPFIGGSLAAIGWNVVK